MVPSSFGLPLPPYDNFKISLNLYACSSRSYKFDNYDKTTYKVSTYCQIPQANLITRLFTAPQLSFGPLSRGSVTNLMLITVFDPLFDPKVTGSLGLSQYPSSSECSALTHFSISLVHKYVNLKEPYNQGIKEQVTNKKNLKKKTGFT